MICGDVEETYGGHLPLTGWPGTGVVVMMVMVGRRRCQTGSIVVSQCYCPYQGYKKAAGPELRCVQRIHHEAVTALMDGGGGGGQSLMSLFRNHLLPDCGENKHIH